MSLEDLFSTFHDFDIVKIRPKNNGLLITLGIPWGELWNDFDLKIEIEIQNGKILECKYYEYIDNEDNHSERHNSIDRTTTDLETIEKMEVDIQRVETIKPGEYVFHCNGYDKVGGAQIRLLADNYNLFDDKDRVLSIGQYQSWYKDWWAKFFD